MSIVVCGSLAFDTIMVFGDRFKNHILPEQIHILNVAFLVPDMRREFGGCAGNIGYNLKLLGENPIVMATVGDDFEPYRRRFDALGLSLAHVRQVEGSYTAQAFITTDLDDNQITAFHPGAMTQSHLNRIDEVTGARLGIVAPDGRDGMLAHARQFVEAGIPFVFDPGQGLPMFSGDELMAFLRMATYCSVNDYEARLLAERTGRSIESLASEVDALIVTLGAEGSQIFTSGERIDVPCVKADEVVDPTGCGDAYRAGLLYGIEHGYDWQTTGRLASLMGSVKIGFRGGQNHAPTRDELAARYVAAFGDAPW
ncbi:MAG TPA: carbohydrate kinase family protein [Nitrospira sp.]|uniref:carbohydrate kinase family protein n=1 Tax=Cognatazoarcus halotolerans TaxID=2686016 RepID=UPI001359A46F|nr:carbohydrate kinase family protein [Cognatazoarcus halotolerans]MCB1898773.1 carbohydrate kinase family protein [Rhodocyclaceae bacterium]MCP5311103.1 carbohydrate kinase family protein [Zoogloeaceae bacterium]HQV12103.1 carbohydrate kinase family protein [Nitrospira sp.]